MKWTKSRDERGKLQYEAHNAEGVKFVVCSRGGSGVFADANVPGVTERVPIKTHQWHSTFEDEYITSSNRSIGEAKTGCEQFTVAEWREKELLRLAKVVETAQRDIERARARISTIEALAAGE